MPWISRRQVIEATATRFPVLNIDDKTFDNWIKRGGECPVIKNGARYGIDDQFMEAWHRRIEQGIVTLDREDYLQCFRFAVKAFYQLTRSDFNRGEQRDVGKVLTNQTSGKLGEIALKRLLTRYGIDIELDFNVIGQIASQDITRISTRPNVWNNPAAKVSIKSTKLKNFILAVPQGEADLADRRSDIYVLSLVGLFPNHILRLIKQHGEALLADAADLVQDFENIPARVAGWAYRAELTACLYSPDEIKNRFGVDMGSPNYILRSGDLRTDWEQFKNALLGVDISPRPAS